MTSDKPDVLFISHDASETGAPRSLLTFVEWLASRNVATVRVVLAGPGPLESAFEAVCPVYRTWCGDGGWMQRALGLTGALPWRLQQVARMTALARSRRHWRPSLIYANTATTGLELAALHRTDVPVVTHVRELDRVLGQIRGTDNLHATLRLTSRFIANSNATKDNLVRRHAIPEKQVEVVYPFVEDVGERSRRSSAGALRSQLGIPPGRYLVLGCGTLHSRKGTDLFIDVAAAVASRRRDVRFVWVGGDTTELTREQVSRMAVRRGLSDLVSFVGHRSDYREFLAAADLLLLSSREEPFGRVVLEAALFGTPTICFANSGGAPEFVRNDAGRVVERENAEAMATAVVELLDSPRLRRSLGAHARERALREHSVEAGAPRIWRIIERTIADHSRAAAA
jgi:glycosyltransferase involved in cell wall biosynthesis